MADDADFIAATKADVVRLPEESLPLKRVCPRQRQLGNRRQSRGAGGAPILLESVEKRLGIKQKRRLNDAILSGFDTMSGSASPFPDFEIVRQEIDAQYFIQNNWSPDTLTEIVRQLTEFKIFAANDAPEIWHSLTDRTVVIDLHGLTVLREVTAFLVLNSIYRELMTMPDSNVSADGVREMRTIIVKGASASFLKRQKAQPDFREIDSRNPQ